MFDQTARLNLRKRRFCSESIRVVYINDEDKSKWCDWGLLGKRKIVMQGNHTSFIFPTAKNFPMASKSGAPCPCCDSDAERQEGESEEDYAGL